MTREEVIELAKLKGYVAQPCHDPDYVAIRSYEAPNPHERMRIGAWGDVHINGDDGWMYQVGDVESVEEALKKMGDS